MTPKEILKAKIAGNSADRNLFCPAIYEHKAKLVGQSVSSVASDSELIEKALLAEYETYQPDMLTVGIDIYNIEAEALGSEVIFSDKKDVVPSIKDKILDDFSGIDDLRVPDVCKAGRIPLFLEAGEKINAVLGKNVPVRGAISGPYSIAAELIGIEKLIMAMMTDEMNCSKLLDLTTSFAISYGKEFINRGLSVCMFDSQASPPLISPDIFEKFLLDRYKKIAEEFKRAGSKHSEFVIGGKTESIAEYMLDSGFDIILSDFASDQSFYFNKKRTYPLIRRNISPVLIEQGDFDALESTVDGLKKIAAEYFNMIIGTGVLSYNVSTENILKIKQMCMEV